MDKVIANSILYVFLSIFYFLSTFYFSSLIQEEWFYSFLTILRFIVLFSVAIIIFNFARVSKLDFLVLLVALVLYSTSDKFLNPLGLLLLISLVFSFYFWKNRESQQSIAKIDGLLYTNILGFWIIVLLGYTGVMPSYTYFDNGEYAVALRSSLGFLNPNPASIMILQSVFLSRLSNRKIIFWLSTFSYLITLPYLASRTSFLVFCVFVLLVFFLRNKINLIKTASYSFLIFLVSFPYLVLRYIANSDWIFFNINLDLLLTTRLSRLKELYDITGLGLFPNFFDYNLDMAFGNMLLKGGLFIYFAFVVLSFLYVRKEKEFIFLVLFFLMLCFSMAESIYNSSYIFTMLVLARIIFVLVRGK